MPTERLERILAQIHHYPPTEDDLREYHEALREDWCLSQKPEDHPLNGSGWCVPHGPSCPMSGRNPLWVQLHPTTAEPRNER